MLTRGVKSLFLEEEADLVAAVEEVAVASLAVCLSASMCPQERVHATAAFLQLVSSHTFSSHVSTRRWALESGLHT
jgi:hypothetical protein